VPSVRFSGLPSSVSSSQVSARDRMMRSAIMSVARSSESFSHLVPPGGRYLTLVSRIGELTSFSEAAPFGHSRPREIGESGSPSIWTTFSSLTYTF
jgi:hypothetical protein